MRTPRARRIGRQEADKLLRGITTSAEREDLLRLLALASAPTRPTELSGREEVLAAFRNSTSRPATAARRRRFWTLVRRALTVKALAGIGVLAIGGAAVAAGTGSLPPEVQHGAHNLLSPLGLPLPDGHRSSAPSRGTGTPPATSPASTPNVVPSGLCDAWRKEKDDNKGKPMDPTARQALANAAGGPEHIADYCGRVLGTAPNGSPSPTPQPGESPSGPGRTHPDPKPSKSKDHPAPTHSARQ